MQQTECDELVLASTEKARTITKGKDTLYHRAQLDPENTLVCPKYN